MQELITEYEQLVFEYSEKNKQKNKDVPRLQKMWDRLLAIEFQLSAQQIISAIKNTFKHIPPRD